MVAELLHSSRKAEVQVDGISISQASHADSELGNVRLSATLKGRYPDIKSVVGDVFGRYSYVSLNHVQLTRKDQTNQVTAQLVLSVWTAPRSEPVAADVERVVAH